MAETVSINGKRVVFGLTWVTIGNPKKEMAEIAALLKKTSAKLAVRHSGPEIKYGLVSHSPELDCSGPMHAAALLFANRVSQVAATQNSLLIQRLGDRKVAVILLLFGVPYLDLVVAVSELDEQLAAIRNEGHIQPVVYGNLERYVVETMTPEMLVGAALPQTELHNFKNGARSLQRCAALLALLLMVAGYGVWTWIKHQQQELARRASDPALLYQASVSKMLATANFNGQAAWETIWTFIRNREIEMAGWSLHSIRCKPTQCEELWQQGNGSYASLQQTISPPQTITLQANNVTSVIQTPLTGMKTALTRADLPEKNALWLELVSLQQRMKRISPLLVFVPKPPKVLGQANAALNPDLPQTADRPVPAELIVVSGEMSVVAPLGLASEIFRLHLAHIMISEVVVEAPGDVRQAKIQIKGNYYAKS